MLVRAFHREKICRGEEASVSRIATVAYPFSRAKGLVERRVRHLPNGKVHQVFHICCKHRGRADTSQYSEKKRSPGGEMLSFLALRLSHAIFPENFPRVLALRYSNSGKTSAIYTEHVPDLTGTIARKKAGMLEFHNEKDRLLREAIRANLDLYEREACPAMHTASGTIWNAGIIIPHPEMNYHYDGKNPVFFEANAVFLHKAAQAILSLPEGAQQRRAASLFGLLVAECLRQMAKQNLSFGAPIMNEQVARQLQEQGNMRKMIAAATRAGPFKVGALSLSFPAPPLLLYFADAPERQESWHEDVFKSGMGSGFPYSVKCTTRHSF